MAASSSTLVQFRAGRLAADFNLRAGSPSVVAKRDLERYYLLLRRSLEEVRFTFPEALTVLTILEDIPLSLPTARFATAIIEEQLRAANPYAQSDVQLHTLLMHLDSIAKEAARFAREQGTPSLEQDFAFDRTAFSAKLKGLSLTHILGCCDAAERYSATRQAHPGTSEQLDITVSLRSLGVWRPGTADVDTFARGSRALAELNSWLNTHAGANETGPTAADRAEE